MGTMRRRAWRSAQNERNGCAAQTRRRGSTGNAPNPVRQSARLAETAIAREAAARRRRGGPGSLPLSLSLSPLSVDRRRGAPSSSSKRSARVQLCWHITPGGGRRPRRPRLLCKESHLSAPARRPDDDPAVPSGPGPAMAASRGRGAAVEDPLRRGCLFRGGAAGRQPCSHVHGLAATFSTSTMPRKTVFEPQKLKPSVEELNMLK